MEFPEALIQPRDFLGQQLLLAVHEVAEAAQLFLVLVGQLRHVAFEALQLRGYVLGECRHQPALLPEGADGIPGRGHGVDVVPVVVAQVLRASGPRRPDQLEEVLLARALAWVDVRGGLQAGALLTIDEHSHYVFAQVLRVAPEAGLDALNGSGHDGSPSLKGLSTCCIFPVGLRLQVRLRFTPIL